MTSTFGIPRRKVVSYAQAHLRLKVWRGRPDSMECTECGETAAEWAYAGGDPNELVGDRGQPYSLDLDRYQPMCKRCHRRKDRADADGRSVDVCAQGHPWAENEGIRRKRAKHTGLRFCRACNRESAARWRARKGASQTRRAA